jgi:hypothetical protein
MVASREMTGCATGNRLVAQILSLHRPFNGIGYRRPAVLLAMIFAMAAILQLGGCASSDLGVAKLSSGGTLPLSSDQVTTATEAARKMTGDATATVESLKARSNPGEPGTHICGYVNANGKTSTLLYIELRDTESGPAAERGQIGTTAANLAKVRFMCRNHGEW